MGNLESNILSELNTSIKTLSKDLEENKKEMHKLDISLNTLLEQQKNMKSKTDVLESKVTNLENSFNKVNLEFSYSKGRWAVLIAIFIGLIVSLLSYVFTNLN